MFASPERLFNPRPTVRVQRPASDVAVVVVDDVLAEPERVVQWARAQSFRPAAPVPYPGIVAAVPARLTDAVADFFAMHARTTLGGRRTLEAATRLAIVTTPAGELEPRQWQCHRDRISADPALLFAASVLYLFDDPALGGTSLYRPRRPPAETEAMIADSQRLDGPAFAARHGVQPGYMDGGNAWFDVVARLPAAWNRMVFYDGGLFHSGDVAACGFGHDPARGRLTLNGFFTCRRQAR